MANVTLCFDCGTFTPPPEDDDEAAGMLVDAPEVAEWVRAVLACDVLVTGRAMIQHYHQDLQGQFSEVCKMDSGDTVLLNNSRTVQVRHTQQEGETEVLCRFVEDGPLVVISFLPQPAAEPLTPIPNSVAELKVQVCGRATNPVVTFVNNGKAVWEGSALEEPSNYKLVRFARPTPSDAEWCVIA